MKYDFEEMIKNRHSYAEEWKKRTGGKVLGYFEAYMPEELVYAAGVLPVRILAEHEPDCLTEKWMYGACYPARDSLNLILNGTYDYLDGLINVEGCQWMYHAYESAMRNKKEWFEHYFFLPDYTDAPTSKEVVKSELLVLKKKVEEWTGNEIIDSKLDEAIEIYNETRRLLRRIYELRKAGHSVILGSEAMQIVLASQVMDKKEFNQILREFIPVLEDRKPHKDMIRLMLVGSETSDTNLEKLIEKLGANVVIDEFDTGSSYFWNEVYPQKDRLMAIAIRYLMRPHNPIKDNNYRRRIQHIFELTEDFAVDGVIVQKQVYCHLHGTDNYAVWKMLRDRHIPYTYMERDNTVQENEMKLRIEAFLNELRPGLNHVRGLNNTTTI